MNWGLGGAVGKLRKCMYGTRDAGALWEARYTKVLLGTGFVQGTASPGCFHHSKWGVSPVVHGGDFTALGTDHGLHLYEAGMLAASDCKLRGRIGAGKDDLHEIKILNRVLRVTKHGLAYEADPRQVERLPEELDLEGDGVKGVVTPGVKTSAGQVEKEEPLPTNEHTFFRGMAARANYLSADRPEPR